MEIFERMGWYGFFAVSSLYLTGAVADGGLGLSSEDRGVIQGLATFFLYLFRCGAQHKLGRIQISLYAEPVAKSLFSGFAQMNIHLPRMADR